MRIRDVARHASILIAAAGLLGLAACSKPAPDATTEEARTADIDAREQAVAQREAELAQQTAAE